jgi:hypothetical protein
VSHNLPALDPGLVAHTVVHDDFDHVRVCTGVLGILYGSLMVFVDLVVQSVDHLYVCLWCWRSLELW